MVNSKQHFCSIISTWLNTVISHWHARITWKHERIAYLYWLFSKNLDTGDAFRVVLCVPVAKQLLNPLNELLTDWEGQQGHRNQNNRKQQVLSRTHIKLNKTDTGKKKSKRRRTYPLQMESSFAWPEKGNLRPDSHFPPGLVLKKNLIVNFKLHMLQK